MKQILKNIKGDKVIWIVVLLLSLISLLCVYSSSGALAQKNTGGNTEYYLIKQALFVLFGFVFLYIIHLIKYTYFAKISVFLLLISIILLIVTFFSAPTNDAARWISIPFLDISFQTSDFAKLSLITYMARVLTIKQEQIKDFKTGFIPIIIPVFIVCGLILYANFSTAAILFTICVVMMFVAGVNRKYLFSMIGIGIVALFIFFAVLHNLPPQKQGRIATWQNRIENFLNKDSGDNYQVEQSKIAIATGGFFGKLPGNSSQRNFLPSAYSDYIFAIIIEEYGIIGASSIILLYLIILYRIVKIVTKGPGKFGMFLTVGLGFSLVFQALLNMGVAVDLLPVTGQTLPFISKGGTSTLFAFISIGMILSVSKEIEKTNENEKNYNSIKIDENGKN